MAVYPLRSPMDMSAGMLSQAADDLTRHTVCPDEIRPGDWLRDLGTLRQVVSMEELPAAGSSGRMFVVRFASISGVKDLALGIPGTVTVTIWRAV